MARVLKSDAERLLTSVSEDYVFRCCDGSILGSLRELEAALVSMSDEVFAFHSNDEKSDYGNWVRDVVGDDKLARDLAKSSNRTQAAKCVTSRVASLDAKLT